RRSHTARCTHSPHACAPAHRYCPVPKAHACTHKHVDAVAARGNLQVERLKPARLHRLNFSSEAITIMNRISITTAAIAASTMVAASASAPATLAFDINNFDYAFFDSSGAAGFGGTDHDGHVEWSYRTDPPTVIADARTGSEGRFGSLDPVSLGQSLKD